METNDNDNSTLQNLWDTAKAMLRGKYTAIQAYFRNKQQSHMNSLNSQLTKLENEEQMRPKVNRRWDIIKIREEMNKNENNKTIQSMKAGADTLRKLTK